MRIAVVGAGPGGAWAARCLARAGAGVTLFDPSHPREKPCGGGITGRALGVISEILPTLHVPSVVVKAARIEAGLTAPGAGSGSTPLNGVTVPLAAHGVSPASSLIVASRTAFDAALVTEAVRAGARLVAERVLDVCCAGNRVTIRTARWEHEADFLIGADGANSLVRRRLTTPFTRDQLSIGTGFFVHGAKSSDIVIGCVAEPPGYLWSFPRPDHLAIGICTQADGPATAGWLREYTRGWMANNSIDARTRITPYSWPIPSLSAENFDRMPAAGARWLLVGDAAGLVDPLTREGIYYALLSGHWAAEALLTDVGRASAAYQARLADEIYPELRHAAQLKHGFFRHDFSSLLLEALRRSQAIRRIMTDLISGHQPYRGLRWRLLNTLEWGLAARILAQKMTRRS